MQYYQVPMGTTVDTWQTNSAGLGPTGPTGATGATGAQGPQGDPGVGFGTLSPSISTRTIGGSAYQVSSTRPAFVSYSGRVSSASTLLAAQAGRIELRSDSSNPPTTVRARTAGGLSGVLATDISEAPLAYIVPAGHYVQLVSVDETGTPTYSLGAQVEIVL